MRWTVGLDLRHRSAGALQLVRWLGREIRAPDPDAFSGVHVLEEEHLELVLRYHHLDEALATARAAAQAAIVHEGVEALVREVELVQGVDAADMLLASARALGADALVVGRSAPGTAGVRIVRLGRVARRLLRRTSTPVVVVPPDVKADALGGGPLVALVRLDERSARTAAFGAALASRLGRPLALVYAIPPTLEQAAPYFPTELGQRIADEQRARGEADLAAWTSRAGLVAQRAVVVQGNPVDAALAFASDERAPLLLVGARPVRGFAHALASGTASVLASVSPVPVIVVPSP